MSELLTGSVAPLESVLHTKTFHKNIGSSMDTPMNDSYDPDNTIQYFLNKPFSVIVKINGRQAAIFGLDQNLNKSANHWFTSTLVFTQYRGKNINRELKRAVALTAQQIGLPLGIIIRDWNVRSYNAAVKAFPDAEGQILPLKAKPEAPHPESCEGWVFDLCKTIIIPSTIVFEGLELALTQWWEKCEKPETVTHNIT